MTSLRLVALILPVLACGNGPSTATGGGGGTSSKTGSTTSGHAGGGGGAGGASGASGGGSSGTGGGPVASATAAVKVSSKKQSVDGFGFATAWGSVPTSENMDAFFSVTKGAGLSIVRNRIPFREDPAVTNDTMLAGGGNYVSTVVNPGQANQYKTFTLTWDGLWDLGATKALIASIQANPDYQVASYFSTPWSPPNNSISKWKTGAADYAVNPSWGGALDPARYADYADVLADYVLGFEAHMGAKLTALSLQNEPSYQAKYESCDWTAAQFHDFIAALKTEFTNKGVFTKLPKLTIMAPEANNMKEDLILPTLADASLASLVGIVAGHQYEFGYGGDPLSVAPPSFTKSLAANKRLWMTEWSVGKFGDGTDIASNLALAKLIHTDFTASSLNAFVYWWTSSLVDSAKVPKKVLWTLGQFSRFIRPGWVRVDADAAPTSSILLSAFTNPAGTEAAIVAVNMGTSADTLAIQLDSKKFGTVTPYRTSATENMAKLPAIAGGTTTVTVTVPAQSITTLSAPLSP